MCGIVGFASASGAMAEDESRAILDSMSDALMHRGPDSRGGWLDAEAGIALGHRRLAIIDLSESGAQPMHSRSGRYVIAFNGELYNFREQRQLLEAQGIRLRGGSDTEVLLESIELWGLTKTLEAANGMFAFALWDRRERTLSLARDRYGEKPLTWGTVGATVMFASETRALRAHPRFQGEIDPVSVASYLQHLCVPGTRSIYRGMQKVGPGTVVRIRGTGGGFAVSENRWWDCVKHVRELPRADQLSEEQAADRLHRALSDSIEARLVSDVPIGVFLSGGLDSSAIVALARERSQVPVLTFSMGVEGKEYDEAPRAREIAGRLGTSHTEAYVDERDTLAVVPQLGSIYDEPFADSSQVPTVLVSRLARKHVTVILAGDGGDELLGGYYKYGILPSLWERVARVPAPLRHLAAAVADRAQLPHLVSQPESMRRASYFYERYRTLVRARDPERFLEQLSVSWRVPAVRPSVALPSDLPWKVPALAGRSLAEELMLADLVGHFSDDLLTKVDRASMSTSLEVRLPFLDPAVVDAAWQLPIALKRREGSTKHVLRVLLRRYLPPQLVDGPKRGFSVPIGRWLAGPLAEWARSTLEYALDAFPEVLDRTAPRRMLKHQIEHPEKNDHRLWGVLMLGAWRLALPNRDGIQAPPGGSQFASARGKATL